MIVTRPTSMFEMLEILSDSDPVGKMRAFLGSSAGQTMRDNVGSSLTHLIPIDTLVPERYSEWRPLVEDAFLFVFSRLSPARLAPKLVEQFELPEDTPIATRLYRLISKMPGIQKLGQVLARNRHLDRSLNRMLSNLENGMSDVGPESILAIITRELGPRLAQYRVEIEQSIFKEGSVSAVVRFTWLNPDSRERERGVFKVMKPYVPRYFAEDMRLLQRLSVFLTKDREYGISAGEIPRMVAEVQLLLEHEVNFVLEQSTLIDAFRSYVGTSGIRVPRPIPELCTSIITAMTEETGVKVTEAFRRWPARRRRIAEQLTEALVAVPLLSREQHSLFHADPHAGNLFYDERTRELVVLDWALTARFDLDSRRHLAILAIMMVLRDEKGVCDAIWALTAPEGRDPEHLEFITRRVKEFFAGLGPGANPGTLDAMGVLEQLAMDGVRFPGSLALFRKVLFTLEGVLHDVTGTETPVDSTIIREFGLRLVSSYGIHHAPLKLRDFASLERSGILYPARLWAARRPRRRRKSRVV